MWGDKRVGEGSTDSDSRSNNSVALHGLLEDNGRDNDNNDTLGSVQDGRGDSSNLGGEGKGELVVEVEAESRKNNVLQDSHGSVFSGSILPGLLQGRKLVDDDEWHGEAEGDDVHDTVDIGRTHVLATVSLQGFGDGRSELSLQGSSGIGHGGIEESFDVDANSLSFLDASETDTTNNRDEHGVGQHGLDIHRRNEDTDNSSEDRLAGLDNLLKGDFTDSGRQDGTAVSKTGKETDRDTGSDISSVEIRSLADSGSPHE